MATTAVELTAADGAILRGIAWEHGACWLVLLHERGWDLDRFRSLVPLLQASDLSALALDRRGHGGSEGLSAAEGEEHDVQLAIRWARASGAGSVIVVAAGDAALLALAAVHTDPPDGYVLLSPAAADPERRGELRGAGVPRLLLVGHDDRQADAAATDLRRMAIGWLLAVGLPTQRQGAELFDGELGHQAQEHLARFAAETHWLAVGAASPA